MLAFLPFLYILSILVFLGIILIALTMGLRIFRPPKPLKDKVKLDERPNSSYSIPENYSLLDPDSKRQVTIQNLYLNHGATPEDIASLLEVEPASVVEVLIRCGHVDSVNRTLNI